MRVHFFQQFGGKIWILIVSTYKGTCSLISALPCPCEDLSVQLEGLLSFRFLKCSTSFERTRKSGITEHIQGISFLKSPWPSLGWALPPYILQNWTECSCCGWIYGFTQINMYCLFVYCLFLSMKVLGSGLHWNNGLHKAEFKHRAKDSSRLLVFMRENR